MVIVSWDVFHYDEMREMYTEMLALLIFLFLSLYPSLSLCFFFFLHINTNDMDCHVRHFWGFLIINMSSLNLPTGIGCGK